MAGNYNFAQMHESLLSNGLPDLGPGPRPKTLTPGQIDALLAELPGSAGQSDTARELIRALVLLWHDHLDAAHAIAQDIGNSSGSFVHGILHRREPDYGNAKYWFHRVGRHAAFPKIAAQTKIFLDSQKGSDFAERLVAGGNWDAYGFIDLCEASARNPASDPQTLVLREIQAIEFRVLLAHFCEHGD